MINILIADDHALVRKGIKEVIANYNDMNVCSEAKNSGDVIRMIEERIPDLIILDINMPGRNGFEILKDIKAVKPEIPVLILSVNSEELYARRCLRAGAAGYMNKDIDIPEFISAIRKIINGQKYISPSLAEQLFSEAESIGNKSNPLDVLSVRESEVFNLLAQKKSVSEIADKLDLSIKTVSTFKARIFSKLNFVQIEDLYDYLNLHNLQ